MRETKVAQHVLFQKRAGRDKLILLQWMKGWSTTCLQIEEDGCVDIERVESRLSQQLKIIKHWTWKIMRRPRS